MGSGITDLELEQKKGTQGHKLGNSDIRTDNIKLLSVDYIINIFRNSFSKLKEKKASIGQ